MYRRFKDDENNLRVIMIELIITLPDYDEDEATKRVFSLIKEHFSNFEGICYYKHPVLMTSSGISPELTLISRTHNPVIIRCFSNDLEDLQDVNESSWTINAEVKDSPLLEADDFIVNLRSKFDKDRTIRNRLRPISVLALPLINHHDFEHKFPKLLKSDERVIWADGDVNSICSPLDHPLNDDEWRTVRSIIQGINPLSKGSGPIPKEANTLGDAIKYIERNIALLDEEQVKGALQIAPGPQRIRGLAGTGKTVLLAMKAATLHLRYPNKKILFTFHTKTLYNQIQTLITKFYRFYSDIDPDWDNLHIRHSWGGYNRQGVYFDTCTRLGIPAIPLMEAKKFSLNAPLKICCKQILGKEIQPVYDFIMVDEAQDLPSEFFQVLYRLSLPPHNIYWVYDELQSLFAEKIPSPEELFGLDDKGNPLVTLDGDPYPGGIEKDLVLHRSYRCPQPVLMLAHAIGLGLYSSNGCVQMLSSINSWQALGYTIQSGDFIQGQKVTILRPEINSPNPITKIYRGTQKIIESKVFEDRDAEFEWIAQSISNDINVENVSPERIIVICLDARKVKKYLPPLQNRLSELGISSTIPGLSDDSAAVAEPGKVTLLSVIRAKGNESNIVYIFSFESIYEYVEELQNRNRAFTSITRSKAWVRITGIGKGMEKAKDEIDRILEDQPRFIFNFPNMDEIRNLDAETARRRRNIWKGKENITGVINLDEKALEAIASQDPSLIPALIKKLETRLEGAKKIENK